MKIKRKRADIVFSKCVRAANNYQCEKCGAQYDKSSSGLHCSHIFSRRHRTIRWCKKNAQSLCFSCHSWFGGNPLDSATWILERLGKTAVNVLRKNKDSGIKVSKLEEKDIAKHYRLQLKFIESERSDGAEGFIDFESWQ